jgi:hypothetical protein
MHNPSRWRTTPCHLFLIAYSLYSQLTIISGSRLLHPQPEDMPCSGDEEPTLHGIKIKHFSLELYFLKWASKESILFLTVTGLLQYTVSSTVLSFNLSTVFTKTCAVVLKLLFKHVMLVV